MTIVIYTVQRILLFCQLEMLLSESTIRMVYGVIEAHRLKMIWR
jgi:hypothetical protein